MILVFELLILLDFRIDIFDWDIADVGGHACIGQSLQRFFKMIGSWVQTSYHDAIRVSTDTLFQKTCKFTVSIRWDRFLADFLISWSFVERSDDLPESEQTLIDFDTFSENDSSWFCYFLPLTSCEIDDFKFAFYLIGGIFKVIAVDPESQNAMGSAWGVIHLMCSHNFIFLSFFPPSQGLFRGSALTFKNIFDNELLMFVPSHFERFSVIDVD